MAVKSARVGDFNGKNLSTGNSSAFMIRPNLPEAIAVADWYVSGGAQAAVVPLSGTGGGGGGASGGRRATFSSIKDEDLGHGEKPDWVTISGTITYIKADDGPRSVMYPSCPHEFNGRPCSKKTQDGGSGEFYCERCSKSTTEPIYRYLVNLQVRPKPELMRTGEDRGDREED